MEPLTGEQEEHVREIIRQEILAALQIVSDEIHRVGSSNAVTGGTVARAINDAAFLFSRRA